MNSPGYTRPQWCFLPKIRTKDLGKSIIAVAPVMLVLDLNPTFRIEKNI